MFRIISFGFVLFAQIATANSSYAYYCSEPSEPSCIDMLGISRDQFSFDMCKSEVESYLADVDAYKNCLISEANSKIEETSSEASSVIDKFNCYARGESICF
jgi:hypothetical protein